MTLHRIRTSARVAAAAALLGAGVLGFAGAATATSGDSVTINHATTLTVSTNHSLEVAATAQPTCQSTLGVIAADRAVSLTLTGPRSNSKTIASGSQPCDQAASLTVTISAPPHNGSYTVTLQNASAANTTTATLDVVIPPAQVKGLAVTTAGTTATFSWKPDVTPDVRSYQIVRSNGTVTQSLRSARACKRRSAHCVTSVDLGLGAAGTSQTFTVRALRCGLSCSAKKVRSPKSRPATATFAAATSPTSAPPSAPGNGGSTGGSGGGQLPGQGDGTPTPPPAASAQPSQPAQPSRSPRPSHSAQSVSPSNPITMTPLAPSPIATASHPATTPPTTPPFDQASGSGSSDAAPWQWIGAAAVLLLIIAHIGALITRRDL
jgi:hypothetical protein